MVGEGDAGGPDSAKASERRPLRPVERLIASLAFPAVLGGALAHSILAIERGTQPQIAVLQAQVPAYLAIIVLERMTPWHRSWNRNSGDFRVDLAHAVTIAAFLAAFGALLLVVGSLLAGRLSTALGSPLWPTGWSLVAQLALALVVAELGQYWVHRLQHEHDLLWRFHAIHHSAPRLYWLNAARFHPIDIGLNALAGNLVLIVLGCGPAVIALWTLFNAVHGICQHANIPVRIGPLNWIFSMAELHRWHHSPLVAESNHNYGQNLAVWDWIFGTRFLPRDREPPSTIGLPDLPAFPMTYLAQQLAPFRWRAIRDAGGAFSGPSPSEP